VVTQNHQTSLKQINNYKKLIIGRMNKLISPFKRLLFFAYLFFGVFTLVINSAAAATVSDVDIVDISARVPNLTPPTPIASGSSVGYYQTGTVTLNGKTFPNARILILRDGVISTSLVAGANGNFSVTISNLSLGVYQFSIISEDSQGVTSSPLVVNAQVSSVSPVDYSNLVIPPTVVSSPKPTAPLNGTNPPSTGSAGKINGFAPVGSTVQLYDESTGQIAGQVVVDESGKYSIDLPQDKYKIGKTYSFRAKTLFNGAESKLSKPVSIVLGASNTPQTDTSASSPTKDIDSPNKFVDRNKVVELCTDYSRDGRINLVDFSILQFWYEKTNPPKDIDCNGDNYIDLQDFSLLMFYWNG
jgi:hypothetical protein